MTPGDDFWREVLDTVASLDTRSYYELLGVARDASAPVIGEAYYSLVRRFHPDRHAREVDPGRKHALVRLYARLGEAYRVLTAPDKRRAYDQALAQGKTRLGGDAAAARPQPRGPDPRTPQARTLFERGKELLARGDARGARAQWQLAIQFEPGSHAIRQALDSLDGKPADSPGPESPGAATSSSPSIPVPPTDRPVEATTPSRISSPSISVLPADLPAEASTPSPSMAAPDMPGLASAPPRLDADHAGQAGPAEEPALARSRAPTPPPVLASTPARRPVAIRCATWEQVASLYTRKIMGSGLLVRTPEPAPRDAIVPVMLRLPDDRTLRLMGRVDEVLEGAKPGLKLRFGALDKEAEAIFAQATGATHEPEEEEPAYAELGKQAFKDGRYAEAVAAFGQALEREPEDHALRAAYYLAQAYEAREQDRMRDAQLHFQTAVHFDPECNDKLSG